MKYLLTVLLVLASLQADTVEALDPNTGEIVLIEIVAQDGLVTQYNYDKDTYLIYETETPDNNQEITDE